MTIAFPADDTVELTDGVDLELLREIERRVLWLAVRIVDAANHDRETGDGVKVGGHQASSASMVSIMTSLWFAHLDGADRVSVKPHASPVLHAIQYLLGDLDREYLTTLRARGGLQSYPSRTKDPDRVDFSTGSVGLGAAAPLFAAAVRRYVDAHFGPRPRSRFVALVGDAELDEGNIWEAISDPSMAGLGNVMWVVDLNRQSLDRVVPGIRISQWRGYFESAGWQVVEVKYGSKLQAKFARPGGDALREWLDSMPNDHYQSLFSLPASHVRARFLSGAPDAVGLALSDVGDDQLAALIGDLGGHDIGQLLEAYASCDKMVDQPSVVFAYTIKGWGLPNAGQTHNHSALLSTAQIDALRAAMGLRAANEWDRFAPISPAGVLCDLRQSVMRVPLDATAGVPIQDVPVEVGHSRSRRVSSQDAFGRVLVDLSRTDSVGPFLVSTAPDVATSTNLAGLINRVGVFTPADERDWNPDELIKWRQSPAGRHIELGISEMNLFLLLGQLGLSSVLSGQRLIPVGTVYDPFVCRGLDALIYGAYSGARFIVAGTPSGVTLAPEGGAHQSTITPSIGLELPGVTLLEPAYAAAVDWLLCDSVSNIADPRGSGAYYFRLSTRPVDQGPFELASQRLGESVLRKQVIRGAYRLRDAGRPPRSGAPAVQLVASGAVLPEVLAAADELDEEGIAAHVVDVTSLDRVYRSWRRCLQTSVRTATVPVMPAILRDVFLDRVPIVTVHDASSHAMAWLGSALRSPCVSLGVDEFGQSGTVHDLYELHDLLPGSIVNAALTALSLS